MKYSHTTLHTWLKRFSLALCLLVLSFNGLGMRVWALSPLQLNVFQQGINYYDVSECGVNGSTTDDTTTSTQPASTTGAPTAGPVYIVGDSITALAQSTYQSKFKSAGWNPTVEGLSSRHMISSPPSPSGIDEIKHDSDKIGAAHAIVVALGTNDLSNSADTIKTQVQKILTTIKGENKSNAPVFWVNLMDSKDDSDTVTANKAITSIVGDANTIDWYSEAKSKADYKNFNEGVHPTSQKDIDTLVNLVVGAVTGGASSGSGAGSAGTTTKVADGVTFDTGMAIDDDGTGSSHNDPNHQGQTSYGNGKLLNADTTNYIALAPGYASDHKLQLGDIAVVQYKGKSAYAVYGDNYKGDAVHGEGSLHLAVALGVTDKDHPGTSMADSGVHYVVYPGSHSQLNGSGSQADIDKVGAQVSGGTTATGATGANGPTGATDGGTATTNGCCPSSDANPDSVSTGATGANGPTGATGATTASGGDTTLSPEQKIAGTFNLGFTPKTSKSDIEAVVKKYKIGGVFILGTTDAAGDGFDKSFFDKLNTDAGHKLVTSSDEEGIFKRYKYSFDFPSAKDMSKMSDSDVQDLGKKVAGALQDNGINTDLAPVLDVAKNSDNSDAGTAGRAFSGSPSTVTSKGGAFAAGLKAGGVNPVYKHFPGLGSTDGNSDTKSVTSPSLSDLKSSDLKPFESLANKNGAAVMMDNAHVPGLTDDGQVASTSPDAVKLLRNDYNFKGLITTDDLTAKGVPGSLPDAVAASLKAGVDMPLFTYQGDDSIDAAISAAKTAGVSTDDSLQKISDFAGTNATPATPTATAAGCCPSSGDDGTSSTMLTGDSVQEKIWNYLEGKGLDDVATAGILGNMQQENSFRTEDNSGGMGLVQWIGGRRTAEIALAQKEGKSPTDLIAQLDYLWAELTGAPGAAGNYSSALKAIKAADTPELAALAWQDDFEHPDPAYANTAGREAYARAWFKKFSSGGSGGSGPAATAPNPSGDGASAGANCSDTSAAAADSGTYKNPFHNKPDGLVQSRIDEGVDYASTKPVPLYAIGNGVVTLATSNSTFYTTKAGHSDWITYKLTDGPAAGKFIYVSEACTLAVHTGDKVTSDTHLCDVLPDSIETGWAPDGTTQIASAHDVYKEGYETAYGVNFNQLMLKLGALGGHLDTGSDPSGTVLGDLPQGWPTWK